MNIAKDKVVMLTYRLSTDDGEILEDALEGDPGPAEGEPDAEGHAEVVSEAEAVAAEAEAQAEANAETEGEGEETDKDDTGVGNPWGLEGSGNGSTGLLSKVGQ